MGYIIVWRYSLKEPRVELSDHYFLEVYSSYEKANEAAKEMRSPSDKWYCEYSIYKEVKHHEGMRESNP